MKADKELRIRRKNGCIQTIPLYTNKDDVKGGQALGVSIGGMKLYAKLVKKVGEFASALLCRKNAITFAAEKRDSNSGKDKLKLTKRKRFLMYSKSLLNSMKEMEKSLTKTYQETYDYAAKSKIKEQLDDVIDIEAHAELGNTFYHQPLEEIPNELDISGIDSTSYMYYGCTDLKKLQPFDTSKIQDMRSMFEGCKSLPSVFPYIVDVAGVNDIAVLKDMFQNSSVGKVYFKNTLDDVGRYLSEAKRRIGAKAIAVVPLSQDRYKMSELYSADYTTMTSFPDQYCCLGMTSLASMYEGCMSMTSVKKMDTSWITDFRRMFYGCAALPSEFPFLIDISSVKDPEMLRDIFRDSSVDTAQFSVEDPAFLSKLTPELLGKNVKVKMALSISDKTHTMKDLVPDEYRTMKKPYAYMKIADGFTDASDMFRNCSGIVEIEDDELSSVQGIKNMNSMFQGCKSLIKAPLIDASEARDLTEMFYGCESLKDINVLNTRHAKVMERMFYGCRSLPKVLPQVLDVRSIGYADALKDMFRGTPVEEISFANMDHEVKGDLKLQDLGESLKKANHYMSPDWIQSDSKLRNLTDFDKIVLFDESPLSMAYSVQHIKELRFDRLSIIDNCIGASPTIETIDSVTGTENVVSMRRLFADCENLKYIPAIDTQSTRDTKEMFSGCRNLAELGDLDLGHVTNMQSMFRACEHLPETFPWTIDLASITDEDDVDHMFLDASVKTVRFKNASQHVKERISPHILGKEDINIIYVAEDGTEEKYADIPKPYIVLKDKYRTMSEIFGAKWATMAEIPHRIDTSKIKDMSSVFADGAKLLRTPELDTKHITNMASMFSGCASLVEAPKMDTVAVTGMQQMFDGCTSLTEIPIYDTESATNMAHMFRGCTNLEKVPHLDTSKVENMEGMFEECGKMPEFFQWFLDLSSINTAGDLRNMFQGSSFKRVYLQNVKDTVRAAITPQLLGCSSDFKILYVSADGTVENE